MTATTTAAPAAHASPRAVVTFIVAAVIAVILASALAGGALLLGANAAFPPLAIYVYAPFVVLGLAAAHVGWRIVRARAAHPVAVLRVLVPVLTVLSFIPDTVLAITGFIPGATPIAVVALALMHVVVVAIAVPMSQRIAPVH